jgi:hypothetical protein
MIIIKKQRFIANFINLKQRERLRFAFPSSFPVLFGKPPELDQTRLVWMEFQPKLPQSLPEVLQEALRVCPMLES